MTIDILGDTHINTWTKYLYPDEREVRRVWEPLGPKGEILIIAGDIGEIPLQNTNFLKTLKRLYYKEVVCVLGNHDLHCLYNRALYLYDRDRELILMEGWEDYPAKIDETKRLYADAGIHLLDGDVIDIDGIKIGGAMGWYDGAYTKHYQIDLGKHSLFRYREYEDLQELWLGTMPDSDIKPLYRFDGLFKKESEKLDRIVDRCDIMISHINPSIQKNHQNQDWRGHPTCGFYSFDGSKLMEKFRGNHWIFGHSHYRAQYDIANRNGGFSLVANALGYPSEHHRAKIWTLVV